MPRKEAAEKKPKSPALVQPRKGESDDEWGGFVQCNLTPMDKALFDQWNGENHQHIDRFVDQHLGSGLKLSLVFDGANNSYIASYTGRPNTDKELCFRCTLSARSGEYMESLALLVYKHDVVMGGDWSPYLVNGSKIPNWG